MKKLLSEIVIITKIDNPMPKSEIASSILCDKYPNIKDIDITVNKIYKLEYKFFINNSLLL